MEVLGITSGEAIRWIAERFDIPRIPKGKHLKEPHRKVFQHGLEGPLELLVQSGIWPRLSPATRSVAVVLLCLADIQPPDRQSWRIPISYRALMRYSGLGSFGSVSKAIRELESFGWLTVKRCKRDDQLPLRHANDYILTPFSDPVREFANAVFQDYRVAIDAEKELRQQQRADRAKEYRERPRIQSASHSKPENETERNGGITKY